MLKLPTMQPKSLKLRKNSLDSLFLIAMSFKMLQGLTRDPLFFKIDMSIRDIGKTIREVEKGNRFGEMDPFMKAIGRIILLMGLGVSFMQMVMFILESG